MRTQRIGNPQRNPTAGGEKRLYSVEEAAIYLGRTTGAVREMLWAGKLPYVRDGRRILLDVRDMDAWIEKSKTRSTY
jgi:excisionase family DNA binding protein